MVRTVFSPAHNLAILHNKNVTESIRKSVFPQLAIGRQIGTSSSNVGTEKADSCRL